MSDLEAPAIAPPPKEDPATLVLRGRPKPAVRFRRGLIAGVSGAAAAGLVTLSWVALEPPSFRRVAAPVENAEPSSKEPEVLNNLPGSYGDAPRLGPPLPGDLGRPILEQQRSIAPAAAGGIPVPAQPAPPDLAADAERQRVASAALAALTSPVLVQLQGSPSRGDEAVPAPAPLVGADAAPPPATSVPAAQQRKMDFAHSSSGVIDPHALTPPASPWALSAGTVIPASLITGLNSDLPGLVLAQVTENVRDSATGRTILVPQGARLIGRYDSVVDYGQRRALVVWNRILFPNGWSIEIDNAPTTDRAGFSGVSDTVDSHGWQLLKGIALSTLLGVGTQLSLGSSESDLVRAVRESAQQNAAHAGDQITSRNLEVQPTLKVRPGFPVRAILNKDLVLQPWRG